MYINAQGTYQLCTFNRQVEWSDIENLLYFVVIKNATVSDNKTISNYHVAHVDDNYVLVDSLNNNLGRLALRSNDTALVIVPSGHLDTVVLGAALLNQEQPLELPDYDTYISLPSIFRPAGNEDSCELIVLTEDNAGDYTVGIKVDSGLPWMVVDGQITSNDVSFKAVPDSVPGDVLLSENDICSIVNELLVISYSTDNVTVRFSYAQQPALPAKTWNLLTGEVS